ncbi:unnamed protein product, partial [Sphagnum tenellum]
MRKSTSKQSHPPSPFLCKCTHMKHVLHILALMHHPTKISFHITTLSSLAKLAHVCISFTSFLVFAFLDLLDQVLCPVFAFLDRLMDENTAAPCYCHQVPSLSDHQMQQQLDKKKKEKKIIGDGRVLQTKLVIDTEANIVSEYVSDAFVSKLEKLEDLTGVTLSRKESDCSGMSGAVTVPKNCVVGAKSSIIPARKARWSDCACSTCSSCPTNGEDLLHVQVVGTRDFDRADNNVIFIHGFLSSSSFWTDTVLPQLPETIRASYRLFAVDLLGFGKSPKPTNCLYTHADHIDMLRRSVIERYGIRKFHVVAHSMGCTVALALAGYEPSAVQSVTLISPPYFLATSGTLPAEYTMQQVAPKKVWPLVAFGASVMSWYEHLGRAVCLVICKHHHFWEPLAAFVSNHLLGLRQVLQKPFFHDFMQHTHHSAWHIFHNTFCPSAYAIQIFMRILQEQGQRVRIIHGDSDSICPIQCSMDLSQCYSNVVLSVIPGAGHLTVVVGREHDLATELTQEILR